MENRDVHALLYAINSSENEVTGIHTILSTEEVAEVSEKNIEGFIEKNPSLIGDSITLKSRQFDTPVGRIDLIFEDKHGNPTVVELKLNKIGKKAVNQLRRYMNWAKKETGKEVSGIIVCKGVMPAFEEDFKKLTDIKIFSYGWQLTVNPWEKQQGACH